MNPSDRAAVTPFLLLGDRHRAQLLGLLEECVTSWLSDWFASSAKIGIRIQEQTIRGKQGDGITLAKDALQASAPALGVILRIESSPQMLAGLVGATASHNSLATLGDISSELRFEALKALCGRILERAEILDVSIDIVSMGQDMAVAGERATCIDIAIGGDRRALGAMLNPALIQRLVPSRAEAASSAPLSDRRAAIEQETVRVEAVLADTTVTLRDLATLVEGNVIVLDLPLDQPCNLTMKDGQRVAKGLLGSTGTHLAVSITT